MLRRSTGEEDRGPVAAQPVLREAHLAQLLLAPQQLLPAQLPHPEHPRHDLDIDQGEQQLHLLHCAWPGFDALLPAVSQGRLVQGSGHVLCCRLNNHATTGIKC
uniref:Uncharacterized protein n=1 Tax=Zea mays TaxID=4577 RepID=A0A804NNX8_MAIZE